MYELSSNIKKCTLYFFLLFPFISCEDDDGDTEVLPIYYWGEASVIIDGNLWEGGIDIAAQYQEGCPDEFSIVVECMDTFGIRRRSFSFSYISPQNGKKRVVPIINCNSTEEASIFYNTLLADGDVLGDVYEVTSLEESDNFIEVTRLEIPTQEVYGIFSIELYLERSFDPNSNEPDTIYVEGTFHTKILPAGEDEYQDYL